MLEALGITLAIKHHPRLLRATEQVQGTAAKSGMRKAARIAPENCASPGLTRHSRPPPRQGRPREIECPLDDSCDLHGQRRALRAFVATP
jgi:hypothetical protein